MPIRKIRNCRHKFYFIILFFFWFKLQFFSLKNSKFMKRLPFVRSMYSCLICICGRWTLWLSNYIWKIRLFSDAKFMKSCLIIFRKSWSQVISHFCKYWIGSSLDNIQSKYLYYYTNWLCIVKLAVHCDWISPSGPFLLIITVQSF